MKPSSNLRGMSSNPFHAVACQAALLFIVLVILATAQTQPSPRPTRRITRTEPTASPQSTPRPTRRATQAKPGASTQSIQVCLNRPADAVMTVQKSAEGHYFAHVDSNGTAYSNDAGGCGYFTVDVIVPRGFRMDIYGGVVRKIEIAGSTDRVEEANCAMAWLQVIIYRKPSAAGASFTKVYDQNLQGVWDTVVDMGGSPYCKLHPDELLEVEVPEGGITETSIYRVLVSPKVNGQVKPAHVSWTWAY